MKNLNLKKQNIKPTIIEHEKFSADIVFFFGLFYVGAVV